MRPRPLPHMQNLAHSRMFDIYRSTMKRTRPAAISCEVMRSRESGRGASNARSSAWENHPYLSRSRSPKSPGPPKGRPIPWWGERLRELGAMDRLLTAEEVAERLGMRTDWVWAQARAGRIPHVRLGRYRRFRESALEAWLET